MQAIRSNFPRWHKWLIVVAVSLVSFTAAFGSPVYTGALGQIQAYFEVVGEIAMLGLSLYVLGFVLGPLLWAPLGEYLGRQITRLISYSGYTAFNGGTVGAQNIQSLLVLRSKAVQNILNEHVLDMWSVAASDWR